MSGLREELKLTQISVLGHWKNSNSINAEKEYLEICLRMEILRGLLEDGSNWVHYLWECLDGEWNNDKGNK